MPTKRGRKRLARKKISEVFFEFVRPILSGVSDDVTDTEIEDALKIGFVAWNCVAMDDFNDTNRWTAHLQERTAPHPSAHLLLDQLIHRKRTLFAAEKELIGRYRVTRRNGEINLWAEARAPQKNDGPPGQHIDQMKAST